MGIGTKIRRIAIQILVQNVVQIRNQLAIRIVNEFLCKNRLRVPVDRCSMNLETARSVATISARRLTAASAYRLTRSTARDSKRRCGVASTIGGRYSPVDRSAVGNSCAKC